MNLEYRNDYRPPHLVQKTIQNDQQKKTLSRAWLITFTDLISLLLTFFVLLFSMSNVKTENWEYLTDTLSRSLHPVVKESKPVMNSSRFNVGTIAERDASNLDYLTSVIEELTSKVELLSNSRVERLDDRLIIAMPGNVMFGPQGASIIPAARDALFALSSILRNVDNRIGINGYSNATQSTEGGYASNWELSIARAAAVSNYLRGSGVDQDITAYGFGNSRYNDDTDISGVTTTDDSTRLMTDRVDIVVFPAASKQ